MLTNGNFDANGHNMTVSGFATDGVCTNSHISALWDYHRRSDSSDL